MPKKPPSCLMALVTVIALHALFIECYFLEKYPRTQSIRKGQSQMWPSANKKVYGLITQISQTSHDRAGSDSLGFSPFLSKKGFQLTSQIIFGSNAIEHGVNLIEEKTRSVLLISGWNSARLDPILWELEPRGFNIVTSSVTEEPTNKDVYEVAVAAVGSNCGAIIAMGCGSVLESAKLASMLVNSLENKEDLAGMTLHEVDVFFSSKHALECSESNSPVLLVTIPGMPSLGAELAAVAAIRRTFVSTSATHSRGTEAAGTQSHDMVREAEMNNQERSHFSKRYIQSVAPDLCLVQPSLTYRAPMELLHDRLLALIGTSIDIILLEPGFLPEMLAWDALRQLMNLFDKAVESAEERHTQWTLDPDYFEKKTVHDDEKDHRSQHFRRYGHGFDLPVVEDLCRVGVAVATARSGLPIGGLQYLSDCMGQLTGTTSGHTRRVGQLLPSYLLTLLNWCDSEKAESGGGRRDRQESQDDPVKAVVRMRLDRISEIFQTSKYLCEVVLLSDETSAAEGVEVVKEIVGETSGQLIHSTVASAKVRTQKTQRSSLPAQLSNLKDHLRLLAGPLGTMEESDVSLHGGDALTRLREKVRDALGRNSADVKSRYNPEDFEKEEKANFVISDYIIGDEVALDVGAGARKGSRRDLPSVLLSEHNSEAMLKDMKSICGDSPISQVDESALLQILLGMEGERRDDRWAERLDSNSNSDSRESSGSDDHMGWEEEVDDQEEEEESERFYSASNSIDDIQSISSSIDETNDTDEGHKINSDDSVLGSKAICGPYSAANEIMFSSRSETKSDSPAQQSAVSDVAKEDSTKVAEGESSHDTVIDVNINASVSANISGADVMSVSTTKPSTGHTDKAAARDLAAAHREKVRKLLARLAESSDADGEGLGARKYGSGDNSKPAQSAGKGFKSPAQDKINSGTPDDDRENALLQEKTDILARLLEQRIHDRWAKSAQPSPMPNPFR